MVTGSRGFITIKPTKLATLSNAAVVTQLIVDVCEDAAMQGLNMRRNSGGLTRTSFSAYKTKSMRERGSCSNQDASDDFNQPFTAHCVIFY